MEENTRKFDSEIKISSENKWYYRESEIVLDKVLDFFKENLNEDELGIYIFNQYKQFSEKGYLECEGIPLRILNLEENNELLYFYSENLKKFSILESNFYFDPSGSLFVIPKDQKLLKYRFSRDTLQYLSRYLIQDGENYYLEFRNSKIPILEFRDSFLVKVPEFNQNN
ncbi:MAG: hypothetical protein H7A24_05260 [Leptospiraceae bacterium]|nr:hypothetical protein [Leptospiraceae bacterium]MCP5511266.1 hypothetical protein [Leptospiraceae bacterium]